MPEYTDVRSPAEERQEEHPLIPESLHPSREELLPYEPKEEWFLNPKLAHHGIHDIGHATRTLIFADVLANFWEKDLREKGELRDDEMYHVDRKVLRLGSAVHDIGRRADVEPSKHKHAHDGAKHFRKIWQSIDPDLTPEQRGKIEYLIYNHCGESLTHKIKDKAKQVVRRITQRPPKETVGIPSPVESNLLQGADGGIEASRVYEKKWAILGIAGLASASALTNQFHGTEIPQEYLEIRNRLWLPGAKELMPLARQLFRESTADKEAYAKDPFTATLDAAEKLGIIKS